MRKEEEEMLRKKMKADEAKKEAERLHQVCPTFGYWVIGWICVTMFHQTCVNHIPSSSRLVHVCNATSFVGATGSD